MRLKSRMAFTIDGSCIGLVAKGFVSRSVDSQPVQYPLKQCRRPNYNLAISTLDEANAGYSFGEREHFKTNFSFFRFV